MVILNIINGMCDNDGNIYILVQDFIDNCGEDVPYFEHIAKLLNMKNCMLKGTETTWVDSFQIFCRHFINVKQLL